MRKDKKRKTDSWVNKEIPIKDRYIARPQLSIPDSLLSHRSSLHQSHFLVVETYGQED